MRRPAPHERVHQRDVRPLDQTRPEGVAAVSLPAAGRVRLWSRTQAASYQDVWGRRDVRLALSALLVAAGYYVGARIGFALTFSPDPVSTLWPPNAILLAALLLAPQRDWPTLVLAALFAHLLVELQGGVPILMVACWFVSNACQALLAAGTVTAIDGRLRLDSIRGLTVFVGGAVLLAPFVTSFLDAGFVALLEWGGSTYWRVWRLRFFSNVLATVTIVPALVALGTGGWSEFRRAGPRRHVEAAFLLLGLIAVGTVALGRESDELQSAPALLYAPLPLLLWAAVRFGLGGLSVSLLLITLLSILTAMQGLGPFVTMSPSDNVLSLQLFVVAISLPLMLLAVLLEQRRRTERALRDSQEALQRSHDRIRDLAGRLLTAQEDERRRIARELHDDLNQQVAALVIAASNMRRRVPPSVPGTEAALQRLHDHALQLANDMRRLSHGLHPQLLLHAGLAAGLRGYCADFSNETGIEVDLDIADAPVVVPGPAALCLYRVAQEALHNVAKHSGARQVQVTLRRDGDFIVLAVRDAGAGFDHAAAQRQSDGLGLVSIEERIRLAQGSLRVATAPGQGTEVVARVPLSDSTAG